MKDTMKDIIKNIYPGDKLPMECFTYDECISNLSDQEIADLANEWKYAHENSLSNLTIWVTNLMQCVYDNITPKIQFIYDVWNYVDKNISDKDFEEIVRNHNPYSNQREVAFYKFFGRKKVAKIYKDWINLYSIDSDEPIIRRESSPFIKPL